MMRFRLLGPVEVRAGEDWRGVGAPPCRSVLAALLIHPGQIVSADTLIGELWRDEPPARAANLVSIYVLRLRRLMDDPDGHLLVTRATCCGWPGTTPTRCCSRPWSGTAGGRSPPGTPREPPAG